MNDDIDALVRQRRRALDRDADPDTVPAGGGPWGLALSGGGIRSATFCFGLLSALARQGLLLRFDLLSTVSGGGYIGSMLGRLLHRADSAGDVRAIVAALGNGSTWFSWWLRANGRYLVPGGVKDRLFALAVYVRNLLGIHAELGLLGILLGLVLAAFNVVVWWTLARQATSAWPSALEFAREWLVMLPTLWLLIVPLLCGAVVLMLAFQAVPMVVASRLGAGIGMAVSLFGCAALWIFSDTFIRAGEVGGTTARVALWIAGLVLTLSWTLAFPLAALAVFIARGAASGAGDPVKLQDAARNTTTKWLARVFQLIGILLLLGLLDRAAWWLAFEQSTWANAGIALAASAAVLRVVLSQMSTLTAGTRSATFLLSVGGLLGRLLTFALFAWWVAVVHKAALGAMFQPRGLDFASAWVPIVLIALAAIAYLLITGQDTRFLNLSSLHGFYRARLVRSYLGATNPWRFLGEQAEHSPLGAAGPLPPSPEDHPIRGVDDVDPHDDIALPDYAPQRFGGPVHLINVCLNETSDPRGGLFNRDRRGRVLTVGPEGLMRVGQRPWERLKAEAGSLTLGSWMAISGAAIAPGLGSSTRGGISALIMFAGARLGYWWDSSVRKGALPEWRVPPVKARGVARETLGIFGGTGARDWFLTDGGHFENTGAYALLAERARLIVIADCGADPQYRFRDLENLVRKARIDLRADVQFLRPKKPTLVPSAAPPAPSDPNDLRAQFGSLNDLASNTSQCCLALARVVYQDPGATEVGFVILVKPNLCEGLPVDLFNFKADHPEFPQQGTADQFFDEAQWESYFQLGRVLGLRLNAAGVERLMAQAHEWFEPDDGSPIKATDTARVYTPETAVAAEGSAAAKSSGRIPARLGASAVSASLGLGAAATVGVAAWQAVDAVRNAYAQQTRDERAALKELADLWAKLPAAKASDSRATAGALAAALARVSDTLCSDGDATWFNRSALAVDILAAARDACDKLGDEQSSVSCTWLLDASNPYAAGPRASCLAAGATLAETAQKDQACAQYWGYDYSRRAVSACAHPSDKIVLARAAEESARRKKYQVLAARPASPTASSPSGAPTTNPCQGRTVYPMLYGRDDAEKLAGFVEAWARLGADIAASEDVLSRARVEGQIPPRAVRTSTMRYHENVSANCANQLALVATQEQWTVVPTPSNMPVKPGAIEIWVAPKVAPGRRPGSGGERSLPATGEPGRDAAPRPPEAAASTPPGDPAPAASVPAAGPPTSCPAPTPLKCPSAPPRSGPTPPPVRPGPAPRPPRAPAPRPPAPAPAALACPPAITAACVAASAASGP